MGSADQPQHPGRHLLGPHTVGRRVVVRRLLRGRTGPSGGPAMTDVLGVMEAWDGTTTSIRPESGEPVRITVADIVSGKPVPPRPSPRLRVSPEDADRRAAPGWRAEVETPLGEWVLRSAGGYSQRANSVLALGEPGVPFADALVRVTGFYEEAGLRPRAHVVLDSPVERALAEAGWEPADGADSDTHLMLGPVAQLRRGLRVGVHTGLDLHDHVTEGWLATDPRSASYDTHARAVLEAGEVVFATLGDPAAVPVEARGRAAYHRDWVGLSGLWVEPSRRGSGLGTLVLATLLEWGAELGATTAYLQVVATNTDAVTLYERTGFTVHHTYRYLTPRDLHRLAP